MGEQLVAAEAHFAEWGFPEGSGESLSGSALAAALFDQEPIEWNRLSSMQDCTLRLIAQRLLSTEAGGIFVYGELTRQRQRLPAPAPPCSHHLFCSVHNAGAAALVEEVATARKLTAVRITDSVDQLPGCEAMLLYLTAATWTSGAASVVLAEEVQMAMRGGLRLLLAHEMPGLTPGREAVDFDHFFAEGQTPRTLVAAGIYATIAVPLKGGAWRETSMALLATEMGAVESAEEGAGCCACVKALVERGVRRLRSGSSHARDDSRLIDGGTVRRASKVDSNQLGVNMVGPTRVALGASGGVHSVRSDPRSDKL